MTRNEEIIERILNGDKLYKIAKDFNISPSRVGDIKKRYLKKTINDPETFLYRRLIEIAKDNEWGAKWVYTRLISIYTDLHCELLVPPKNLTVEQFNSMSIDDISNSFFVGEMMMDLVLKLKESIDNKDGNTIS